MRTRILNGEDFEAVRLKAGSMTPRPRQAATSAGSVRFRWSIRSEKPYTTAVGDLSLSHGRATATTSSKSQADAMPAVNPRRTS